MSYFDKLQDIKARNEDLVAQALSIAKQKGADEAKIRVFSGKGVEVSARHGEVENIEFNQDQSMEIIIYKNKCNGQTRTTDLSRKAIEAAVDSALSLCEFTSYDEFAGLADPQLLFKCTNERKSEDLGRCYQAVEDTDEAVKRAEALDQLALSHVGKVSGLKDSDGAAFESSYTICSTGTSTGFLDSSISSFAAKSVSLLAQRDNEKQASGYASQNTNVLKLRSDDYVVDEAVRRTVQKLGSRKVPTGNYNIILSRSAVLSFISNFISSITGSAIYRNTSFMCERLHTQVMPEFINIKEDPWLFDGFASAYFDGDGVATKPLDIVSNGILNEYLTGTYSARRLNLENNAHNGSSYNWFITADEAHTRDIDSLIKEVGTGIVVHSLMGQGVDMVSGNYSRGASGYYFENGERQFAVDEITIAGNLKDMFKKIALVGTDYNENSKIQVGSIFIPNMAVSGS